MTALPRFAFRRIIAAVALLLAAAGIPAADTIYKYVDRNGRLTYSSTPPGQGEAVEGVTELNVPEAPAPEDVEAARRRVEEYARLAKEMSEERRKADAVYEQQREAALQRELMERQLAAMESPYVDPPVYGGSYFPPLWAVPPVLKPRPPVFPGQAHGHQGRHSSRGSFGAEPVPVPFRR